MTERKPKNIFVTGPIKPAFIGDSIQQHSAKTNIGAHSIFLGQVRADSINDKNVTAIEYTTYTEMALEKMHEIREAIFGKYALTCMHVYHSLGHFSCFARDNPLPSEQPQRFFRSTIDA